jgi:hypothetical protein
MNELRLTIPQKLEEDFHQFRLSECKTEEAIKIENIRHMMKMDILRAREKDEREFNSDWELMR